jgi:hypothetical protein
MVLSCRYSPAIGNIPAPHDGYKAQTAARRSRQELWAALAAKLC